MYICIYADKYYDMYIRIYADTDALIPIHTILAPAHGVGWLGLVGSIKL